MSYQRTPQSFLSNSFIAPHNFNDPEHPEHGQYVNAQIKNDLYYDILFKISNCQFDIINYKKSVQDEELQVEEIKNCEGADPLRGFAGKIGKKADDREIIACQDWTVRRKGGRTKEAQQTSKYRVKVYQTKGDLFFTEVHPPTLWKLFKCYTFN